MFRTLSILGYRVVRISNENSLESLLARLFRANIDLSVIYDIGAYKGEWATQVNLFLPNSQIFMFEPNSAHNESLVHTQFPFFNVCFSDQIKEVEFYQTFSQGDSYFKEDS